MISFIVELEMRPSQPEIETMILKAIFDASKDDETVSDAQLRDNLKLTEEEVFTATARLMMKGYISACPIRNTKIN